MHEKAKFVSFIYMLRQKVKFKYVQINMKQVSYSIKLHVFRVVLLSHIYLPFALGLNNIKYVFE